MRAVHATHEGGDRFRLSLRTHELRVDQPRDEGGTDTAPTPVELFVASIVACQGFFARRFLARHGIADGELELDAEYELAADPSRVASVHTRLHLPRVLPAGVEAGLRRAVESCTVHHSIRSSPSIDLSLATPAELSEPVGAL